MRVLLGLMLGFMATVAQAQSTTVSDAVRARIYVEIPNAAVVQWLYVSTGERTCEMVMEQGGARLHIVWSSGNNLALLVVRRERWRFPAAGIETPVEVSFDNVKMGSVIDGKTVNHVVMRGFEDGVGYAWPDLSQRLEAVKTIRLRYLEGLSYDDVFQVTAMRLFLIGVRECREDISTARPR